MTQRAWHFGLAIVVLVCAHNTIPHLTMLPRVNVDEPWLIERGYQVLRTGIPSQPMLGLQHAYLLQVGYGYVLAVWMAVAGVGLFQARLLAVCMGLGIVVMTATIGRRAIDSVAGLSAAMMLALDSNMLGGMRTARTDIPSVFFVVCAFAAYVRGYRLGRSRWFAVAGASLGAAMLCHGNAFWAGFILLAWFLIDYGRTALRVPYGYAVVAGWLATFGPYLAVVFARWSDVQVQIGNFAADRVPGWRMSFVLQQMARESERYRGWYFGLVTGAVPNPFLWVFQALVVAGLVVLTFRAVRARSAGDDPQGDPHGPLRIVVLAAGGAFIFAGFINNKVPVYMPHILFGFALAAGTAASQASHLVAKSRRTVLALTLLTAYAVAGVVYVEKWYAREGKSELVPYESTEATLRLLVPGGAKTIFASPQFWTPFHAEVGTRFLSFAAAQPIETAGSVVLAGASQDRVTVLLVDEYQWLPELIGVSSSLPQWQRDWIAFIQRHCGLHAVAYGSAHGTIASYVCELNGVPGAGSPTSAPRIVGGSIEYRPGATMVDQTTSDLSAWARYTDPRRLPEQEPDVQLTPDGVHVSGTGWPGIETQFTAEAGSCYVVHAATSGTRDGDLLYLGGWERPQVQSLSGASTAGIPAPLLTPAWFPRDRAFRATADAVRIRIYSEAPRTDFFVSSFRIARLEPVR